MDSLSRLMGMRRPYLLLLAVLLALVVVPSATGRASASCAGPSLRGAGSLVLERGSSAVTEGRHFTQGCRDSMSCPAFGCGACEYDEPPSTPMQDVTLRLTQGGRTWLLATSDAESPDGRVRWEFRLPEGVDPGRARLVADGTEPVMVRIA